MLSRVSWCLKAKLPNHLAVIVHWLLSLCVGQQCERVGQHCRTTCQENVRCLMFDAIVCPIRLAHTWPLGFSLWLGCSEVSLEMTCSHSLHPRAAGQALGAARRGPVHDCCRRFDCRARSLASLQGDQRIAAGVLWWPGYRKWTPLS